MQELTPRQSQVLAFIRDFIVEQGMPPTRAEIARALGFKSIRAPSEAAALLRPGDTCIIHQGVYRETMVIPRSGEPDSSTGSFSPAAQVMVSAPPVTS